MNYTICIVGEASRYTPDMLVMLCNQKERFLLRKIVLYDIEEERQTIVGKYAEILFREYYPELEEIVYTTDKETGEDYLPNTYLQYYLYPHKMYAKQTQSIQGPMR